MIKPEPIWNHNTEKKLKIEKRQKNIKLEIPLGGKK
jgi:hypothetical protein